MKTTILALLLISSINMVGQTIEKFYTYNWKECEPNEARFYSSILKTDSGYVRNDYFVHEKSLQMSGKYSDVESKNADGHFYYFHPNGKLDAQGKYENGKKEGLWVHYFPNGVLMDSGFYSKGNGIGTSLSWHLNGYLKDSSVIDENGKGVVVSWFDNGNIAAAGYIVNFTKKNAIWKFYHKNGQLSSKETYQNDVLTNTIYYDENGVMLADTKNRDRDAAFPGGNKSWQRYLLKQANFPEQFKIVNADKAVVVVSFTVSEDGKVEEVEVSTPFFPQFDKIAKNAIMSSPNWEPAISHNRKVKFRMRQPITFAQ